MAFHAIKAGEGETFISAGVETVSRFFNGYSDVPDAQNPLYDEAQGRTEKRAAGGAEKWEDPRTGGELPDLYISMGQTAENVAQVLGMSRKEQDEFGVRSQNLAEERSRSGFLGTRHHAL
jgi:acetyl-CoA C-acetyltransferase